MKIAADSWFLFLLAKQEPSAIKLLNATHRGKHPIYFSTLSLAEFSVYAYHTGKPIEARKLLAEIKRVKNVTPVPVTEKIASDAARQKVGLGLSLIDAIILSTALIKHCDAFIASDLDFNIAKKQGLIKVCHPEALI